MTVVDLNEICILLRVNYLCHVLEMSSISVCLTSYRFVMDSCEPQPSSLLVREQFLRKVPTLLKSRLVLEMNYVGRHDSHPHCTLCA